MSRGCVLFNKLVIFGVGLIGGSLARALRERAGARRRAVVGVGRSADVGRARAGTRRDRRAGALDDDAALAGALARRRRRAARRAGRADRAAARAHRAVSRRAHHRHRCRQHEDRRRRRGAARVGRAHRAVRAGASDRRARVERRRCGACRICTSIATSCCARCRKTRADDVERVAAMWRATGACVREMTPEQHDRVFASVSHLPHVLSFALVEQILDSARCRTEVLVRRRRLPRLHADRRRRARKCGATSASPTASRCSTELDAYTARAGALARGDRRIGRRRARSRVRALARRAHRMAGTRRHGGAAERRRRKISGNWTHSWNTSISDLLSCVRHGAAAWLEEHFEPRAAARGAGRRRNDRSRICSIPTTRA